MIGAFRWVMVRTEANAGLGGKVLFVFCPAPRLSGACCGRQTQSGIERHCSVEMMVTMALKSTQASTPIQDGSNSAILETATAGPSVYYVIHFLVRGGKKPRGGHM